jgi:hypothetical protein
MMTPSSILIAIRVHKSTGEAHIVRRETMTNAVIISGMLAGVPVIKILKIGVTGHQIQIEKMTLPVKKFSLTIQVMVKMLVILRRGMKGTVLFLGHGTPTIS